MKTILIFGAVIETIIAIKLAQKMMLKELGSFPNWVRSNSMPIYSKRDFHIFKEKEIWQ